MAQACIRQPSHRSYSNERKHHQQRHCGQRPGFARRTRERRPVALRRLRRHGRTAIQAAAKQARVLQALSPSADGGCPTAEQHDDPWVSGAPRPATRILGPAVLGWRCAPGASTATPAGVRACGIVRVGYSPIPVGAMAGGERSVPQTVCCERMRRCPGGSAGVSCATQLTPRGTRIGTT